MGRRGRILFLTLLVASAVQTTMPARAAVPLPGLAGRLDPTFGGG